MKLHFFCSLGVTTSNRWRKNNARQMPNRLLPISAGVTDKCMTSRQYEQRYGERFCIERSSNIPAGAYVPPPPMGSGTLEHEQQLLSVYTHLTQEPENAYEVSTWHKDVQMVDYIFYSVDHRAVDLSAAFRPRVRVHEIQVRLMDRLRNKFPCRRADCMYSHVWHFPHSLSWRE